MSMRSVYRKIAKKNGVSVAEVKREMEKAIDAAWDNPAKTQRNIEMQKAIKADGTKPSVEEFVVITSKKIKGNT